MGRLSGHILPGSFFIGFGLWWIWAMYHRYFICKRQLAEGNHVSKKARRQLRYVNTASYVGTSCCSRIHLEGIIKVLGTSIGIIGELITAFNDKGEFVNLGNGQHMAMYFFFGLNGVMDIIQFHRLSLFPDMDYISGILALLIEAFLFWNHLHGRPPMDVQIHVYLVYAVVAVIIASFCEMLYRNSPLPALAKIFFTILQGTWFYHVGFILYPPNGNIWDVNSHSQMMTTTTIYACHCAGIFIFMSIMAILIHLRVKRMDLSTSYEALYSHTTLNGSANGSVTKQLDEELMKSIISDSDEEMDTGI